MPATQPLPLNSLFCTTCHHPQFVQEFDRGEDDIAVVDDGDNSVTIHEPRVKVDLTNYTEYHKFVFDSALGENVSND